MKKILTIMVVLITMMVFSTAAFASDYANANANANVGNVQAGSLLEQGNINSGNVNVNAPIPGTPQYAPLVNYFGKPLPSEGFEPVGQIIMYGNWFTEGALENMCKWSHTQAEVKVARTYYKKAAPAKEDGKTRWIKVVVSRKKYTSKDMTFIAYVTARSNGAKDTMVEVMARAALEALRKGANVIHFTAQGACRDVEAFGWGIGFNGTHAQINGDDSNRSFVSTGGFGISKATAGTRDKPWLQGFAIVDYTLEYPTLDKAPTKK